MQVFEVTDLLSDLYESVKVPVFMAGDKRKQGKLAALARRVDNNFGISQVDMR